MRMFWWILMVATACGTVAAPENPDAAIDGGVMDVVNTAIDAGVVDAANVDAAIDAPLPVDAMPDAMPIADADTCPFDPWAGVCTYVNECVQEYDGAGCGVCRMMTTVGSITWLSSRCCEQACCVAIGWTCAVDGGTP